MKDKRKRYISQFYHKNKFRFFLAILASLLTAALNLAIAWVLQQMIDTVSGVPGALSLSMLAALIAGVIVLIVIIKALNYVSKPQFIQKAMHKAMNNPMPKNNNIKVIY